MRTVTPSPVTGWFPYYDPQSRFTLQYPADWAINGQVERDSGQFLEISSPINADQISAKINIGIFNKTIDDTEDLMQWLDAYNKVASDFAPDQIQTHQREAILINGLEAIHIVETSPLGDYQYTVIRWGRQAWFVWSNIGQEASASDNLIYLTLLRSLKFSPFQTGTITITPDSTITIPPQATPTVLLDDTQGLLAYLENDQITIRSLSGQQAVLAEGQYKQILGWSPNHFHLLAIRRDGNSVVIDRSGKTLAAFGILPQPAFWMDGYAIEDGEEDWLAVPRPDAALELVSFPSGESKILYVPGSLGEDGLAYVRWGSNGSIILTPSLAQLQSDVQFTGGMLALMAADSPHGQLVFIEGTGGGTVGLDFQPDFQKSYFQVLDSVPGSPASILLGFVIEDACSSCAIDGLELTSLELWPPHALPLGAFLLNTPEAYTWNPVQPGLLALAEGGSRYTLENKRLALLDVPAGILRYLTGEDQAAFEPSWSPDGRRLAYTTMTAQAEAAGSWQEMEVLMGGRAIAVYDLTKQTAKNLTHPAKDEIDGWPRWSEDGNALVFARKRFADSTTQVWQMDLATGREQLVVSIAGTPLACHQVGCGWDQMLAYAPGHSTSMAQTTTPVLAPTPTPIIQPDPSRQGWMSYHNTAYGFSFQYPSTWELDKGVGNPPNFILLKSETGTLMIGYRRATQQARIQRTGTGAGDFVRAGSIQFLDKTLQRDLLVYGGKVKEVFYQGDCEFRVGELVFTLGLNNNAGSRYEDADIPLDFQKEADQILESFQLVEITP